MLLVPSLSFGVKFREDLLFFDQHLCNVNGPFDSRQAMALGLKDAQTTGFFLKGKNINALKASEIFKAKVPEGYFGGSFAVCKKNNKNKAWFLYTRSPVPFANKSFYFELNKFCRKVKTDAILWQEGRSFPIVETINSLKNNEQGSMVSVSCLPKSKKFGYQTWILFPTDKKLLNEKTPYFIKGNIKKQHLVQGWVQQIRKKEGLKPFRFISNLKISGSSIFSIDHNLIYLKNLRKNLKGKNLTLVGEDLVQGKTVEEIVWLLWSSPRHRDLLLDSKANSASLIIGKINKDIFARIYTLSSKIF